MIWSMIMKITNKLLALMRIVSSEYTGSRGKVEMNELVKKNEDLLEEIVDCEKDTM